MNCDNLPNELNEYISSFLDPVTHLMVEIAFGKDIESICFVDQKMWDCAHRYGLTILPKLYTSLGCTIPYAGFFVSNKFIDDAIAGGHIAYIKSIYNNFSRLSGKKLYDIGLFSKTIKTGKKDLIDWAIKKDFLVDWETVGEAIGLGDTGLFEELYKKLKDSTKSRVPQTVSDKIIEYTAKSNNYNVLEWITINHHNIIVDYDIAAKYKNFALLEYLYNGDYNKPTSKHYRNVNNSEYLEWLKQKNVEFDDRAYLCAIENGNLDVLKKLYMWFGYPLGGTFLRHAVISGNMDIVKWLVDRGCTLYGNPIPFTGKNLHIMKWLRNNGIVFVPDTSFTPKHDKSYLEFIIWLVEIKFTFNEENIIAISRYGFVECLEFLHSKAVKILVYRASLEAALNNRVNVLQFMYNCGLKLDINHYQQALVRGNIDMVKWLYSKNCPYNDSILLKMMQSKSYYDTVLWMIENHHIHNIDYLINKLSNNSPYEKYWKKKLITKITKIQ